MELLSGYELHVLTNVLIYVVLAVGLQVTVGFGGQISIGHAAFAAIGAYTTAILSVELGWQMVPTLALCVAVSGFAGVILGLPSLRVRHDFLAIVTIGFTVIVQSLANRLPFTGASLGISGIPQPDLLGVPLDKFGFTLFVTVVVILSIACAAWLSLARVGLAWRAVREDELAASAVGFNVRYLKVAAFAVGAAYAGLGGGFIAYNLGFVGSDTFGLDLSIGVLAMIVVGGLGSLSGAVVGAVLLTLLPEWLRGFADLRLLVYGALLALIVIFRPAGLLGNLRLRRPWARRQMRSDP